MKLSKIALLALRGMSMEEKERMARVLGVTLQTFYHKIRTNETNGMLTKAIAIESIERETGLGYNMIVEDDTVKESNGLES